jgi:hypothetical protein
MDIDFAGIRYLDVRRWSAGKRNRYRSHGIDHASSEIRFFNKLPIRTAGERIVVNPELAPENGATGAVKGAPLLGAAKRTLDGEDRYASAGEKGVATTCRRMGFPGATDTVDSTHLCSSVSETIWFIIAEGGWRWLSGSSGLFSSWRSGL